MNVYTVNTDKYKMKNYHFPPYHFNASFVWSLLVRRVETLLISKPVGETWQPCDDDNGFLGFFVSWFVVLINLINCFACCRVCLCMFPLFICVIPFLPHFFYILTSSSVPIFESGRISLARPRLKPADPCSPEPLTVLAVGRNLVFASGTRCRAFHHSAVLHS